MAETSVRLPAVNPKPGPALFEAKAAPEDSRDIRVRGRFAYRRKKACIDTDFDYLIDSCANDGSPCLFNGDCEQDLDGADSITVQLKSDIPLGPDYVVAETKTNSGGYFNFLGAVSGTPDLYVQFETKNGVVEIESAVWEINYKWRTDNYDDFGGTEIAVGSVGPAENPGAVHIHNSITRAARWYHDLTFIWTPQVDVRWPSAISGWYNNTWEEIWLSGETTWSMHTHAHEWGHHWLEMFTAAYQQSDYCNNTCDAGLAPICGHCMWCDEDVYWAWYEGWAQWIADAFLRSFESRYGKPPLFMPAPWVDDPDHGNFHERDDFRQWLDIEKVPSLDEDDSRCRNSDDRLPCTCGPRLTEGFLAGLLRDIEDENEKQSFNGVIASAGEIVEHEIYLRQADSVAIRVNRVLNTDTEGTLNPAFVIWHCDDPANPTLCTEKESDEDRGSDFPPGPGRNAAIAHFEIDGTGAAPPTEDSLWKIAVQGQNDTAGPYTVEVEWLDDHNGDGIADELNLGADDIFEVVFDTWPLTATWFIDSFDMMHPSLINDLWSTATNIGYDIPDDQPPENPTDVTCESHVIGDPNSQHTITVSWTPGTDDISGILGYDWNITPGAPADPGTTADLEVSTVATRDVPVAGTYYFNIRAIDRAGNPAVDYVSIGPIEVIPECHLTLLAPNGGEAWRVGTIHQVTWDCGRNELTYGWEPVKIDLYKGGAYDRGLGSSFTNSQDWEIFPDVIPGDDYQIRIRSRDVYSDWDDSDAYFTIEPDLIDHGDGTVSHLNSCLMWLEDTGQAGVTMTWENAAA
jgi:hypothetical protein